MNPLNRYLLVGTFACLATACSSGDGSQSDTPESSPNASDTSPSPSTAQSTQVGDGSTLGGDDIEIPGNSRAVRRITLDMLTDSLPILAGTDLAGEPITWTIDYQGQTYTALDENILGGTMGKANYVDVTAENPDPSTLYLKFADDLARDVCEKIIEADYGRGDSESRTFMRFAALDSITDPEGVTANLQYIKLRFFGQKVDTSEQVEDLHSLYEEVLALYPQLSNTERSRYAWQAVCIGTFLSPSFHVY